MHSLDGQLIDASKLAAKSAHSTKVKKLAKRLIETRQQDDATVAALANKLAVTLKDPSQLKLPPGATSALDKSHAALASLGSSSGAAFDAAFLASVDGALKGELGLLSQVDAKAANPELKALAQKLARSTTRARRRWRAI